jgi:hypothetical protein
LVTDRVAAHGDLHFYSHLWEEEMRWRRPRRSRAREGLHGKDGLGEKSHRRARRKSAREEKEKARGRRVYVRRGRGEMDAG